MPFRLKLRRTRRYNVLSKNYFVTRIRLLDSNVIECTLSVESTGQECLEAVAQRLELREVSLLCDTGTVFPLTKGKIICKTIFKMFFLVLCCFFIYVFGRLRTLGQCDAPVSVLSV